MPNYDFQTLNDKDFEELTRDLINKKLGLELQNFKRGKDGGIDLRYSTDNNSNKIIVQVKHFYLSGYKALLTALKEEVQKVKLLNPDRYIISTSIPLSPDNQKIIKNLFDPFIKTENDIIGNETLNAWLIEFPEIEKAHFKLWMSSVAVIENILKSAIIGRSIFHSEEIKSKISLYVPTRNLDLAFEILSTKKALIISGEPGIGKSTLAEILCLKLMSEGYGLYKIESVKEAEEIFSFSPDEKQLFYFDDFLGAIYIELTLAGDKTDSQLNSLIRRIRKVPNKLLIFTTRTVILNQAFSLYEKFKIAYSEKENIEIKVTDYSLYDKALILYNHLYFRGLNEDFLKIFYEQELYFQIVKHPNYNPRIIDFISDVNKIEVFTKNEYRKFIIETLQNPATIWDQSFHKQINSEQRFLLLTLFSYKESIAEEEELQETFNHRMEYEIKVNGHQRSANSYLNSIKILLNGFIIRRTYPDVLRKFKTIISFINPSLSDFFVHYLANSEEERIRMLSSFIYIEQFEKINVILKNGKRTKNEIQLMSEIFITNKIDSLNKITSNILLIKKCKCLFEIINVTEFPNTALELFTKINWEDSITSGLNNLSVIFNDSKKIPDLFHHIKSHFTQIIKKVIDSLDSYEDHLWIKDLFEYYREIYEDFIKDEQNQELVVETFQYLFEKYKEEKVDELKETITSYKEATSLENELNDIAVDLQSSLLEGLDCYLDTDTDTDWEKCITSNESDDDEYNSDYPRDYYKDDRRYPTSFKLV